MCWFRPGLDHIFVRLGPAPLPNTSFTAQSSCSHLRGKFSSLGTGVTIPSPYLYIFELISLSLFPSWLIEFLHMPNELNGLSDPVLSHWLIPTKEEFPRKCGQEDRAEKKKWEGWGLTNWRYMWSSLGRRVFILIPINVTWHNSLCKSLGIYSQCWK
jgi:hypothetical protein